MRKNLFFVLIVFFFTLISSCQQSITITFITHSDLVIEPIQLSKGDVIPLPSTPTREGYLFNGWYLDDTLNDPYNPKQTITSDMTLYAKWDIQSYTISFEENGGEEMSDLTLYYSENVILPTPPTKEGYTFGGWYVDAELTQSFFLFTMPASDFTIYAKWEINSYSVIFKQADGTEILRTEYAYGALITDQIHEAALLVGYQFIGWDHAIPVTMPAEHLEFQATYEPFEDDVQSFSIDGETIIDLSSGVYSIAALTSTGKLYKWGREGNPSWLCGPYNPSFDTLTPRDITSFFSLNPSEKIMDVEIGTTTHAVITNQGRILTWSYKYYCGYEPLDTDPMLMVKDVTSRFSFNTHEIPVNIHLLSNYPLVITSDHRILVMNMNDDFVLSDIETNVKDLTSSLGLHQDEHVIDVSIGWYHNLLMITNEGRIFALDHTGMGQFGTGDRNKILVPTEITHHFPLLSNERIIHASIGSTHTLVQTNQQRVFAMGNNTQGQLGDSTTIRSDVPLDITSHIPLETGDEIILIHAGGYSSYLMTSSGDIYAWGSNLHDRVLAGDEMVNQLSPVKITDAFDFIDQEVPIFISASTNVPVIVTSTNTFYVFGTKTFGITIEQLQAYVWGS